MSGTLGIGLLFNATWTLLGYICFDPKLIYLLRLHFCAESVTTKHPPSLAVGGGADVPNNLSEARGSSSTVVCHYHRRTSVLFELGCEYT